jgi:membrane protease YdiL (CAAX protease family)
MEKDPPAALLAAMLGAIVASLLVWVRIIGRRQSGQPVVPREPRIAVPWHFAHVFIIVLTYLTLQIGVAAVVLGAYDLQLPAAADAGELPVADEGNIPPEKLPAVLLANALANLLVVAISMLLLRFSAGATLVDFGFVPWRPHYDIPLGVAAFFASLLPVYAIQMVLTQFFPSKHPVAQLLTENSSPAMLMLCALSAAVVAPVAEEFLFRGILQGWLERSASPSREPAAISDQYDKPTGFEDRLEASHPAGSEGDSANPYRSPDVGTIAREAARDDEWTPSRWQQCRPILLSSLAFALVHLGHGPDPIPLFILALVLGYLYQRTHRLWPCIVLHMCLNSASLAMLWAILEQ